MKLQVVCSFLSQITRGGGQFLMHLIGTINCTETFDQLRWKTFIIVKQNENQVGYKSDYEKHCAGSE